MPSTKVTSGAATLPKTVRPTKYRLTLQPNIDDFTFKGSQSVDIEILEPTSQIVLNAIDLEIGATVLRRNGTATGCRSVSLDEGSQTATLDFGETQPAGEAQLEIEFTGVLNDKL